MSYYQTLLTNISPRESAVDCSRCSTLLKCCTYRPFIANFLAGQAHQVLPLTEELFLDWDFLITGLSPSLKYRKQFFKNGKWGFGTDATLLCSFYDKSMGGCKIWKARPAVCRTFFCKSSYSETGMNFWKKAEEFTWHMEWTLLEDFLFTRGWTLQDVKVIKHYLHDNNLKNTQALPQEYRFESLQKAIDFYQEASRHVEQLLPEYVEEIVGDYGRHLYKDLVAEKPKLV